MKTKISLIFVSIAAMFFIVAPSWAFDGSLDTTFNATGKVITDFGTRWDGAFAVAIQSDGKIVAAGESCGFNDNDCDFALVRYNTDGSLDTTFNTTGKVTTAIGTGDDAANAVAIQSDGKIVAAGGLYNGAKEVFALVRYNTDGSLDTTFNTTGKVTTAIGTGDDWANAVAIQSDGKIVVAGYSYNGSNNDFALVRYNTDGSLDTTFNTNGKVTTAIGTGDDWATAVAIQSDGKIVVAGDSNNGSNFDFALVRYNTNGSLDTTFNTTGKVTTAIGSYDDYANALGIQSDNKIVVAGDSNDGGNNDFAVVRYNTDGTLDTTFNTTGKVTTAIGSYGDGASAVAIQSDGKIVAAGFSYNGSNHNFALVRYNTDGTLDTTFNTTGKVTTDIVSSVDGATALGIQSDNKIVAAGASNNGSNLDFAVVRYLAGTASGSVSGTVSYSGSQTGNVYVGLFSSPGITPGVPNPLYVTTIASPGSYTITGVPDGTYYVGAIRTNDINNIQMTDPYGMYGIDFVLDFIADSVIVSGGAAVTDKNFMMIDGTQQYPNPFYVPPAQHTGFPIATTAGRETSCSAAFDGTNYLVAIYGVEDAPNNLTAQFIDQSGNLIGSNIVIGHIDRMEMVAFDGTNYLMVWVDNTNYPSVLYGQFISKSRSLVGSPFQIASFDYSEFQRQDEVEGIAYGGGNYLVVYDKEVNIGGDSVVYGRIVSPSGIVGSEIAISSGYGHQGVHNVAFDGANFFVVWTDDSNDSEVKGRFISPSGVLGTEVSINTSSDPSDNPLTVAFDGTNYLVVYTDEFGGPGSGNWDVHGQMVTPSGGLTGGVIFISTAPGQQFLPLIAFDGTNYMVTWTDMRNDANKDGVCDGNEGTCWDIYGQYVSKTGDLVGSEFVINNDAGNQMGGVIGFNNGKYLALINNIDTFDGVVGDVYGMFLGGYGSGTHTASGTGEWNGTDTLTITTTASDFICDGLMEGPPEIITEVAIAASTMTWSKDGVVEDTWTRSPAGDPNDPVGVWTMSNSETGNSYTLTIEGGAFTLAGVIIQCSSGGGSGVSARSEHWNSGYQIQFWVNDPMHQYSSVTVSGYGIAGSGSCSLAYQGNGWNGWNSSCYVTLGTEYPTVTLPLTYTFKDSTSNTIGTDNVEAFVEPFATGLAPTGTFSVNPAFAWAGVGGGYTYGVEVNDSIGNRIWSVYDLTTPAYFNAGFVLTEGMTYNYDIQVRDTYGNASFAQASFTYQTVATLTVSKTGSGTVTSDPAGINCDLANTDCSEVYDYNTVVNLAATPDTGSTFTGWSGDADCSDGSVTMNDVRNCTANFAGIPNISSAPTSLSFGSVSINTTSTAQQITVSNTGEAGLHIYTATITGDYIKQVDTCSGNTVAPTQSCQIQIAFKPLSAGAKAGTLSIPSDDPDTAILDIPVSGNGISQYTLTAGKSGTGFGIVTSEPSGINCSTDCSETYSSGASVTLTATADTGSTFGSWTGCDSVSGDTCDITMNSDKTVTAAFIPSALYVVWQDDTYGNNEIFLKKSIDGGNTWVFQRLTNNTGNSQSPAVAVNGNEVYVVWQDDTYGPSGVPEIFMKRSTDSGATWQFQRITTNTGSSFTPDVVASGNNVYVVWEDNTYGNAEIFLKKSTDGGNTWVFQRLTTNTGVSMNPSIAVNGNNVYAVWQDDTYGPAGVPEIFMKRSTDSGATWQFQRITTNAGYSGRPSMVVDGGNIYVVWPDDTYATGVPEIFFKKSTDGGNTWTFQRLTTNAGYSGRPSIALSSSNLYVVWEDNTYLNNEIFFKKSTDGGNTWTFQRLTNNTGISVNPSIRVNGNDVYAVWQDDTYGPSGVPEIFLKRSTDSGATWQFQRLTTNTGISAMPAMAK